MTEPAENAPAPDPASTPDPRKTTEPPRVDFVVTDEDVLVLRGLRPRRLRFKLVENVLHVAAAGLAIFAATLLLLARRADLLPMTLAAIGGIWLAGWIYLGLFLFRRSPESVMWLEKLRQSPVLSLGPCTAEVRDDGLLLVTPTATRHFAPAQLEDAVYDEDRFFIRTVDGQAIIIPQRAFDSQEAWATFVMALTTKADW